MSTEVLCKITYNAWSSGLLKELNILRESSLMCDVKILLSGGIQTTAHSCVLSAASPFFKSLLVQIENPEIDMSSFPSEVIQQILTFIYTGETLFRMADLFIAHKVVTLFNIVSLVSLIHDALMQHELEESDAVSRSMESESNTQEESSSLMTSDINDKTHLIKSLHQAVEINLDQVYPSRITGLSDDVHQDTTSNMTITKNISKLLSLERELQPKKRKRHTRVKPVKIVNKEVQNDIPTCALDTLPDELFIQKSTFAAAEKGVFTRISLPRGSIMGPYEGDIVTDPDAISQLDPRYCWTIYNKLRFIHWLNGEDESRTNWMRFVQAADANANLTALQRDGKLFFEVTHGISPTEELLVSTGSSYIGFQGNIIKCLPNVEVNSATIACEDALFKDEGSDLAWIRSVHDQGQMRSPMEGDEPNDKPHCQGSAVPYSTSPIDDNNMQDYRGSQLTAELDVKDYQRSEGDQRSEGAQRSDGDQRSHELQCIECEVIFKVEAMFDQHMLVTHGHPLKNNTPHGSDRSKTELNDKHALKHGYCEECGLTFKTDYMFIKHLTFCQTRLLSQESSPRDSCDNDMNNIEICSPSILDEATISPDVSKSLEKVINGSNSASPMMTRQSRLTQRKVLDCDVSTSFLGSLQKESCLTKSPKNICNPLEKNGSRGNRATKDKSYKSPGGERYKCGLCCKTFTQSGYLKIHQRIHTGERPFICEICGRKFSQKSNLQCHRKRHDEKNYPCKQCEKSFSDWYYLKNHMRASHWQSGGGGVICPTCGKHVKKSSSLSRHMMIHAKKLYECSRCGKGYDNYSVFQSHQRLHLFPDGKQHQCSQCSKRFKTKQEHRAHKAFHSREKSYTCLICCNKFGYMASFIKHQQSGCNVCMCQSCGKSYDSLVSFKEHIKSCGNEQDIEHSPPKAKTSPDTNENQCVCLQCGNHFTTALILEKHEDSCLVQCPVVKCGKIFSSHKYLTAHAKKHGNNQPFVCEVCSKNYPDRQSLKIHRRVHSQKKHTCLVCGKCCLTPSILQDHMLIHTGEKPHQCDICNLHFRRKNHLQKHMDTHNIMEEKQTFKHGPVCEMCGKSFCNKQALKTHQFLHTGSRPFVCDLCGRAFATKGSLKTHVSGHLGERRYKCLLCSKSYRANKDFQLHLESHAS